MDRTPAVITAAEYSVYQPGMAALTVRTQPRSFTSLNAFASGGAGGGVDVVGLAVVIGVVLLVAHLAGRGKK